MVLKNMKQAHHHDHCLFFSKGKISVDQSDTDEEDEEENSSEEKDEKKNSSEEKDEEEEEEDSDSNDSGVIINLRQLTLD